MEAGLEHLHSFLRWIALLAIVISLFKSFGGMRGNKPFGPSDNRWSLITLIVFHTQMVIGFALYFLDGWHRYIGIMDDTRTRFFSLEHVLGMLVAITLITVGRAKAKKAETDHLKHKRTFWFFLIAFILVLISIPWPFREVVGAGRTWFPGM